MRRVSDSTLADTIMLTYWDKDLICKIASKAFLQWIDMHPDEVIDKMHVSKILGTTYKEASDYFQKEVKNENYAATCSTMLPNGRSVSFLIVFSPDKIGNEVLGFYAHIVENTDSNAEDKQASKLPKYLGPSSDGFLSDIVQVLKDSLLSEFPGIKYIAKKHFVSESKLKRDFKKKYQCSVFSYYRRLQMELAEEYLRDKKYNKNQLALLFNFSNPSNFSARFSRFLKEKSSGQTIAEVKGENYHRYKRFTEQSAVATAMLDAQLLFIEVSQKWIDDYTFDVKNVIGQSIFSISSESASYFHGIYERALQRESCKDEYMFVNEKDGSQQWLREYVTPWFTDYGTVGGIIIHREDITRFKLKEQKNGRERFEVLCKVAEISRLGIWTRDFRTHEVEWNEIIEEIFEVPADFKPNGHSILDFYREGESRTLIEKSLHRALHEGEGFDIELELISAKGNLRWVRVIGYVEFYNERCNMLMLMFQDITHIRIKLKAIRCS
ncbi:MAG: PAS domain S-box protein [Mucilaginibacter sp.]